MHTHHLKYVRLTARVLSGMLFILWGSFFIDHLSWFMESSGAPPTHVWLMQGVHLLLLLGYLILFKWEYIGSFLLVLCSVVFFWYCRRRKCDSVCYCQHAAGSSSFLLLAERRREVPFENCKVENSIENIRKNENRILPLKITARNCS